MFHNKSKLNEISKHDAAFVIINEELKKIESRDDLFYFSGFVRALFVFDYISQEEEESLNQIAVEKYKNL